MIPFQIKQGLFDNLPNVLKEGTIYYCIDRDFFCIDMKDEDGVLSRKILRGVGEDVSGDYFTINDVETLALTGAEIFNDYENNIATGNYSHAEGTKTIAKGYSSHAEGGIYGASSNKPEGWTNTLTASDYPTFLTEDVTIYGSIANGNNSHAEGGGTYAHGEGSHAEGNFTLAMNYGSHSEGYGTQATGYVSHAEGYNTQATQQAAHAEGNQTKATSQSAHAEGNYTEASGDYAHAEGNNTKASGPQSHAEGSNTKATASCAHAEGYSTEAAYYSHSEGGYTKALGNYSHSEGHGTEANGQEAHAEGHYSKANGNYSHAEGYQTETTADGSHAEGYGSEASGSYAHAEGFDTQASGFVTHAEGCYTHAIGQYSHAEGEGTIASGESQHVQGKYNIEDTTNKYAHIIGNGAYQTPSNAHTLDWEGNAWFAGDVRVGGTGYDEGFDVPLTTKINIPKGRMKGDVDGDGRITQNDYDIILDNIEQTSLLTDEIQLWCADVSGNGKIDNPDRSRITAYILGKTRNGFADYYNNWSFDTTYNTDGYFYVDYPINGMTADSSAVLIVEGSTLEGNFAKLVCSENNLRLYANFCPINDQTAILIWSKTGNTTSIVDNVTPSSSIAKFSNITIPKGRMRGDVDGDGEITEEDTHIVLSHVINAEHITDEEALVLADMTNDGIVNMDDVTALQFITAGKKRIGEYGEISGNWSVNDYYDEDIFQFYTDIAISDMTIDSNVVLYVDDAYTGKAKFMVEPQYGNLRIYTTLCPIENIECTVSYTISGSGITSVVQNVPEVDTSDCVVTYGDTNMTVTDMYAAYKSGRSLFCYVAAAETLLPLSYAEDKLIEFYKVYDNVAYQVTYQGPVNKWNASVTPLSDVAVVLEEQTLTDEQKEQVRTNIGAGINPYMTKVILTPSGWDATTLTQVTTIQGIKADETAQAIYINPVFDNAMNDEIGNCNVYASAQGENSITFSCDSIPTIDVEFYVKWQEVNWIKPIIPPPDLIDFKYDYDEANDTYTLTSWKGTTDGVAGTEIIIPNDARIII